MKVKFCLDSGANAVSCNEQVLDLEEDLGFSVEEWTEMSELDQWETVKEFFEGDGHPEIWWEECD